MDKECDKDCIAYDKNAFKGCGRYDAMNNADVNIGEKMDELNDNIKDMIKAIKRKD
jgi:hypothetical protein